MIITNTTNFALIVDGESSKLRVYLRAYFTILFILLPLVGDQTCHALVKYFLAIGRNVPVTATTGWVSTSSAAHWLLKRRCLPAGWFGVVMLLAGILNTLSDFAVSGYVKNIYLPGRCQFNTGVVLPSSPVSWRSVPSNQQRSYTVVSQAQITSARNGGLVGIFAKADTNPLFSADNLDVVGGWRCSESGDRKLQNFQANASTDSVATSLEAGLLFPGSTVFHNTFPDGSTADTLAVSASVLDGIAETWAIRVSLDTTAQGNYKPSQWPRIYARWKAHP